MCELKSCDKYSGKATKRFCGSYKDKDSCASKQKRANNKKYAKEKTENNRRDGTVNAKIKREKELLKQGYERRETYQGWLGE